LVYTASRFLRELKSVEGIEDEMIELLDRVLKMGPEGEDDAVDYERMERVKEAATLYDSCAEFELA